MATSEAVGGGVSENGCSSAHKGSKLGIQEGGVLHLEASVKIANRAAKHHFRVTRSEVFGMVYCTCWYPVNLKKYEPH